MKIALSNLAWDKDEDAQILKILKEFKIRGIEVSLTKIWEEPIKITEKQILSYKKLWKSNGINIVAITSVLYGHPELVIFNSEEVRNQMFKYLNKVFNMGSLLGAKAIVFGSPKNRSSN